MDGQLDIFQFIGIEKYKITKPIRLIELFAGIGAQAKALERIGADFEHYKVVEFDKHAIKSYNAIHGTNFEAQDICKIHAKDLEIVEKEKYTYLLTYSFPCQDLSVAGKQRGMTKDSGTRSGLLWEVERILKECENLPNVLLMENVPQVHGYKFKADFDSWCKSLENFGYTNFWKDLNSKDFGVAQSRNRTFMISILQQDVVYEFPKPFKLEKTIADYLEDEVDEKYYINSENAKKMIANLIDDESFDRLKINSFGNLGVGKQRGEVYSTNGILACESATQYKDPLKILVKENEK